jgi:hypothetical protein
MERERPSRNSGQARGPSDGKRGREEEPATKRWVLALVSGEPGLQERSHTHGESLFRARGATDRTTAALFVAPTWIRSLFGHLADQNAEGTSDPWLSCRVNRCWERAQSRAPPGQGTRSPSTPVEATGAGYDGPGSPPSNGWIWREPPEHVLTLSSAGPAAICPGCCRGSGWSAGVRLMGIRSSGAAER